MKIHFANGEDYKSWGMKSKPASTKKALQALVDFLNTEDYNIAVGATNTLWELWRADHQSKLKVVEE